MEVRATAVGKGLKELVRIIGQMVTAYECRSRWLLALATTRLCDAALLLTLPPEPVALKGAIGLATTSKGDRQLSGEVSTKQPSVRGRSPELRYVRIH
jgi:hypothetical protein